MTEVMDCFDFNQLQPNESQDQCGFAAVALCFAAGPPGKGPRQPVQWAIQMMAAWYTEFDGPNILSNKSGMEDWQLYKLIVEKGGHYQSIDPNAASIASWIQANYPVIVGVTEDSVYDVHLKAKPYTWNTSGISHIFTVTGIDHDHIFLVRDTVNQHDGSPYSYDGDKLSYLSATVFVPDWMPRPTSAIAPQGEETVRIDITTPGVPTYFEVVDAHHWRCKQTGHLLGYGMLDFYKGFGNAGLCGLTYLGLNKTDEILIEKLSPAYVHLAGKGITIQFFERGVTIYDPGHLVDNPPGAGSVYLLQLYNNGPGQDPGVAKLQATIADLTAANNMQAQKITDLQQVQAVDPLASQALTVVRQIKTMVQPF